MSILILCTGKPAVELDGMYSSSEFDSAVKAMLDSDAQAPSERKIAPAGRRVFIAEGGLARSTADQILQPCSLSTEPLLNEIPVRSYDDTDKRLPADKWFRKAASQRKAGDPRQAESRKAAATRADALIEKLENIGCDTLLITYPLFLTELLDRLRTHGYVVQRSGLVRIQPLEKIVVSRREEHCGGCQHNCFLSNPGCGVGRDKAMRRNL